MHLDVFSRGLAGLKVDCIIVGVFDGGALSPAAREVDRAARGALTRLVERGDLTGRSGELQMLPELRGVAAPRVLVAGLGKNVSRPSWRRACLAALAAVGKTRARSAALALERPPRRELDDLHFGRSIAEFLAATLYRVNDLKTGARPPAPQLERLLIGPVKGAGARTVRRGIVQGLGLAAGLRTARDLANLPANVCTPAYLAETAAGLAGRYPSVTAEILDEAAIRREKMGCLLAVAQGSEQPPRFIVLQHRGGTGRAAPVVLVGKGVTFDTGGISLKDPGGMDEMKFDMSGAAAVLGAIAVAAELGLPIDLIGLVPAAENMPSGRAIKPGDIVTSAAGFSVEILNTDAEGRLLLCDALHYARRFKPRTVIDIATLTGACVIALGAHHTGVFANDAALARELVDCGLAADDRGWHMPLTDEYAEALKSNFADFANVGGREGGAITAAAYLGKFTQGLRWAHLDIAGTAWLGGAHKGATGRPVALLTEYLIRSAAAARRG
jgi:leucyl aminopeptidase